MNRVQGARLCDECWVALRRKKNAREREERGGRGGMLTTIDIAPGLSFAHALRDEIDQDCQRNAWYCTAILVRCC